MSRRSIWRHWLVLATALLAFEAVAQDGLGSSGTGWAVSLRVLQTRLAGCGGDCPAVLKQLGGLSLLRGYLIDDSGDVVLFGVKDGGRPPLLTEDFAVALRNAWWKYAVREGNKIIYSNPGCSIDPDNEVMKRLTELGQSLQGANDPAGIERVIGAWVETCSTPQRVRLLGVPKSHLASVMVRADYLMKKIVDGSLSTRMDGFTSLNEALLNKLRDDFTNHRPLSLRTSPINRFEFVPGEVVFGEDLKTVRLEQCPVQLVTEQEYLSRSGEITGTGRADPAARRFAEEFSRRYPELRDNLQIYWKLEGVFRMVAISKSMKERVPAASLGYLLERYPVPRVAIDMNPKGLSRVQRFEDSRDTPRGEETISILLPSCGGVSINIDVKTSKVEKRQLEELRRTVLDARMFARSLAWPYAEL